MQSAPGRNRTGTALRPTDFKSVAKGNKIKCLGSNFVPLEKNLDEDFPCEQRDKTAFCGTGIIAIGGKKITRSRRATWLD